MPANAVPCRQAKAKYCGMPAPAAAFAVPCRQRLKPTARILAQASVNHSSNRTNAIPPDPTGDMSFTPNCIW
jgi:hypothetical protein